MLLDKPYSHGGILRFSGQSMSIKPKQSACYACIFDSPPPQGSVPSCAEAGVFGSIAGILGTILSDRGAKNDYKHRRAALQSTFKL